MFERETDHQGLSKGKEGDAGEAEPAADIGVCRPHNSRRLSEEEIKRRDLLDGPPLGYRAGTLALSAAGARMEEQTEPAGIPDCFEVLGREDEGMEDHIIRGID